MGHIDSDDSSNRSATATGVGMPTHAGVRAPTSVSWHALTDVPGGPMSTARRRVSSSRRWSGSCSRARCSSRRASHRGRSPGPRASSGRTRSGTASAGGTGHGEQALHPRRGFGSCPASGSEPGTTVRYVLAPGEARAPGEGSCEPGRGHLRHHGRGGEALRQDQHGLCAICGPWTGRRGVTRSLSVDHDHRTGEVRGLLCRTCNDIIGLWRDNPNVFKRALEYLVNPPARRVLAPRDWSPYRGGR